MQLQQMGCCRLDPLHIQQPNLVWKSTWCIFPSKIMRYCGHVTSPDCHVRLKHLLHVSLRLPLPPSYHLIRTTTCIHLTLSLSRVLLHFPSFPQNPPGKLLMEKAQGRKGEDRGGAEGAGSPSHNAMPPERARGPELHALCCRKKQHIFHPEVQ